MPVKIKEVAFVCHTVADIARAREFYGNLLGLKAGLEMEFAPGVWWIEYDVGSVALAVTNGQPPAGAGGASVALEVSDFDGALAAVRAAGIPLTIEPQDFAPCRMFGVNSPDGYAIMFHQRKA
jgi:catechol 2,3-dioxygenase-like lactoylglutathione lyase family enzyme